MEITNFLENTLKVLTKEEIVDSKLRSRYAEYLIAYELAKRRHDVQLSNIRDHASADIYLSDIQKKVEVKSGKYHDDKWAYASFGKGKQILKNKFDYCVFVTFDEFDESKINEIFIFTKEELVEVAISRPDIVKHPETNDCLLMRAPNFKEYQEYIKNYKSLKIESDLNKYPEKYDRAWDKIK